MALEKRLVLPNTPSSNIEFLTLPVRYEKIEGNFNTKNIQFLKRKDFDSSEMIRRSEMWRRQYSEAPYLRHFSREQLLEHSQQLW